MKRKSPGTAALLSFLLGPLGGLYIAWWFAAGWLVVTWFVFANWGFVAAVFATALQAYSAAGAAAGYNNQHREEIACR